MKNNQNIENKKCLICDKFTASNFRIDAFNYVCSGECFNKALNAGEENIDMDKNKIKRSLEKKGFIVDDISKNYNFDKGIYILLRKKQLDIKYNVLVELEDKWTIEDVIISHNSLFDNEDYKNTNDDEWDI